MEKCLECGNKYDSVNSSHLKTHNISLKEYREKYKKELLAEEQLNLRIRTLLYPIIIFVIAIFILSHGFVFGSYLVPVVLVISSLLYLLVRFPKSPPLFFFSHSAFF